MFASRRRLLRYAVALSLSSGVAAPARAVDTSNGGWHFEFTPYFCFAGLSETAGVGNVDTSVSRI